MKGVKGREQHRPKIDERFYKHDQHCYNETSSVYQWLLSRLDKHINVMHNKNRKNLFFTWMSR